jgi:outer membrane protein assembly factor BamB
MNARWLLLGAALGLPAVAAGDDWPQWRGPGRDNKVKDFVVPKTWPKALSQKWKVPVGEGVASPVLVGDKLYAFGREGEQEVVRCLDAGTGKEVWKDAYPAPAFKGADARAHSGPRSTPAVAEGKVCTLGVHGVLSCVDAATGKFAWRNDSYKAVPKFHTSCSPVIVDGRCVAQVGGEGKGQMVALDLATGQEKWKWGDDGVAYSSPVVATIGGVKQVVAMTDRNLVGVGLDGKLLWKAPFQAARYNNTVTPIIDGETVICAGQGTGTAAVRVEKQGDAFAVKELWRKKDGPHMYNTPTLKDGRLYGLNPSRNFYCMDAKTGDLIWTDLAPRGECGAILDAGPVMLALTSDTNLVVFKPGTKEYEEIAKIKVADSPTWAVPIVSGNRVYVKDRDSVSLLTFE